MDTFSSRYFAKKFAECHRNLYGNNYKIVKTGCYKINGIKKDTYSVMSVEEYRQYFKIYMGGKAKWYVLHKKKLI